MAETELERAEKRYAQAKARLQGLKARETTRQRKLDTRRKVILGGALLDLAERDSGAAAMLDRLVRNLAARSGPQGLRGLGMAPAGTYPSPTPPSAASDPDSAGAS